MSAAAGPDATGWVEALARGDVTSRRLAELYLARIAERDAAVLAWAHLDPAQVRASADAIDRLGRPGRLHGLPIGVKDVFLTRDMPTRYNSPAYAQDAASGPDAASVALLRNEGGLILGKTATVEFASIGGPPPTHNPHRHGHTPGGSSSGSAAAVADGQVPLALGTQTGGSIMRPASFCGAWAMKPSWGSVNCDGLKPFAPSLDTIGWFARSARDLGLLLTLMTPPAPPVPARDVAGARIAVWHTPGWAAAERPSRDALAMAVETLRGAGAVVEDLQLPPDFADCADLQRRVMYGEGRTSFLAAELEHGTALHPRIRAMVRDGGGITAAMLDQARDEAALARRQFDRAARGFDAVLSPSAVGTAPAGLDVTGDLLFNGLLTLLHVPCINVPLTDPATALPIGLTLSGVRGSDRKLVAIAVAVGVVLHAPA